MTIEGKRIGVNKNIQNLPFFWTASLNTEKNRIVQQKNEISWADLVNQGVIEYLDAAEEENALVAFYQDDITPEHTHLEITPLAMVGLCTRAVIQARPDRIKRAKSTPLTRLRTRVGSPRALDCALSFIFASENRRGCGKRGKVGE